MSNSEVAPRPKPPSEGPFDVFVKFTVKPEKVAEVSALLEENKRYGAENEPGTLYFHAARKDNTFYVWEKYANAEALEFHQVNNPGRNKAFERARELMDGMPDIQFLETIC